MSNAVDWSGAPDKASCYADGRFWNYLQGYNEWLFFNGVRWELDCEARSPDNFSDHQQRPVPQEKPMKYKYGVEYPTNGVKPDLPDDVLVCFKDDEGIWDPNGDRAVWKWNWLGSSAFSITDERYMPVATPESQRAPATATEYLSVCAQVQLERGGEYNASGTSERSFDAAAEAFNCITGKHLRGSDVCLILELVKKVRQYSDPTRFHADSVLDAVSYGSLWAEELTKELK